MKIQDIADQTKMSRTTISALYHNNSKGIQFDTMDALCKVLRVTPNELLSYEPLVYSFELIDPIPGKFGALQIRPDISYRNKRITTSFAVDIDIEVDINDEGGESINYLGIKADFPQEIIDLSQQIPKLFWTALEKELCDTIVDHILATEKTTDDLAFSVIF